MNKDAEDPFASDPYGGACPRLWSNAVSAVRAALRSIEEEHADLPPDVLARAKAAAARRIAAIRTTARDRDR